MKPQGLRYEVLVNDSLVRTLFALNDRHQLSTELAHMMKKYGVSRERITVRVLCDLCENK